MDYKFIELTQKTKIRNLDDALKRIKKEELSEMSGVDLKENDFDLGSQNTDQFIEARTFIATSNKLDIIYGICSLVTFKPGSPDYEKNKEIGLANIFVSKPYRKDGMGSAMLEELIMVAKDSGLNSLNFKVQSESGKQFMESREGILVSKNAESRLMVENIDWNLFDKWKEEKNLTDIGFEVFIKAPDHLIAEFCEVYQFTLKKIASEKNLKGEIVYDSNTRRQEETNLEDIGLIRYTMISREKSGEISGFSQMIYNQIIPYIANQDLSGVKENYLNSDRIDLLKIELTRYFMSKYPSLKYIIGFDGNFKFLSSIHSNKIEEKVNFNTYYLPV